MIRGQCNDLLLQASRLWHFDVRDTRRFPSHEGGRNAVFAVGTHSVLRISSLTDRTPADYMAETAFVHYLAMNGAPVADVIPSAGGKLVEFLDTEGQRAAVSLFQRAEGDQLADHGYRYIEGVPIDEYWRNTGKALGRIHALSRRYQPEVRRFDFFDKYNEDYLEQLIPDDLVCPFLGEAPVGRQIRDSMHCLLERLRALPADEAVYGMIHFDYSDGNYNIDYTTGAITVFDFDNCRTGWYLFDLANLWAHGVGWIAWNPDADERRRFMERYFSAVCEGYRSEAELTDETLSALPLMVDAVRMENIIDEFEVRLAEDGCLSCDGEQAWRIKCLLEDAPFMGFFCDAYDPESPFDLDP